MDILIITVIAGLSGYLAGRWHAKRIAAKTVAAVATTVTTKGGGGGGPLEPL